MSPLLYVLIRVIGGGFVVAVIALVAWHGTSGSVQVDLVKRLEMIDRGLRDEFSATARKQARPRRISGKN
jgi:hypothetical protein